MSTSTAQGMEGDRERPSGHLLGAVEIPAPLARPHKKCSPWRCAMAASIIPALLGFEMGVLNEMTAGIKKEQDIRDKKVELLTGVLNICSIVGAGFAALTWDRRSRRSAMVLVWILFYSVAFLIALARSYFFVLLGRSLAQIGTGFGMIVVPVYVAEISPASSRGLLMSLPEICVSIGTLLGYLCNHSFSRSKFNGSLLMLCNGVISLIILAIVIPAMPESPRWLIMQYRLGEAKDVLSKISSSEQEADVQFDQIKEAVGIISEGNDEIAGVQSTQNAQWRNLLSNGRLSIQHMLSCTLLMQFFRQTTGFDTIILYTPQIFKKVGINYPYKRLLWTSLLEVVKTMFNFVATCLLDRTGRRLLLLTSVGAMAILLFLLGAGLRVIDQSETTSTWVANICIGSLYAYVAAFSLGMGPVTSVYSTEIFPLRLRVHGCTVGFVANQLVSAAMSFIFLAQDEEIDFSGTAFTFATFAISAWIIFFVFVPETLGTNLEGMGDLFGASKEWTTEAGGIEMESTTGLRD